MKIITYNVNGIRAALKKGFAEWIVETDPDIFCLQEVKAEAEQADLTAFEEMGYHIYWHAAEKKGYSGVATFSKTPADHQATGMGHETFDSEGRILRLDFGEVSLLNVYIPSGTTGEERQNFKYEWLDAFFEFLEQLRKERPKLILCGDYNICHHPIDIHDPVSNKKSSGFLPEERAWVTKLLEAGFTDAFRYFFPEAAHQYTWWTYRAGARKKNKGWRLDYFTVTENLNGQMKDCRILSEAVHSDHCPVLLDIDMP